MINLRKAVNEDRIEEFIVEREAEAKASGDEAAFNRAVQAMARTSKEAPATSKKRSRDG